MCLEVAQLYVFNDAIGFKDAKCCRSCQLINYMDPKAIEYFKKDPKAKSNQVYCTKWKRFPWNTSICESYEPGSIVLQYDYHNMLEKTKCHCGHLVNPHTEENCDCKICIKVIDLLKGGDW